MAEPLVKCASCKRYVAKSQIVEIEEAASKVKSAVLGGSVFDKGDLDKPAIKQVCKECLDKWNAKHSK